MLFGTITRNRYGNYILKVDGHPDRTYMYYTKSAKPSAVTVTKTACGIDT